MKKYDRRDFLKLTGASALALALAACGGGPSVRTGCAVSGCTDAPESNQCKP